MCVAPGRHGGLLGRRQFIPNQRLFLENNLLALEELLPPRHDFPDPPQRLELATLSGQRLGGIDIGENTEVPFDFNGSELVAVATPCVESFMATWGPGQRQPTGFPTDVVCPTARLGRMSLGRHGLTATVACPASPPVGCLTTTVTVELRVHGRLVSTKGEANRLFPGRRAMLTAPLGAGTLRWLRRHRHQRVIAQIESGYSETSTVRVRLR